MKLIKILSVLLFIFSSSLKALEYSNLEDVNGLEVGELVDDLKVQPNEQGNIRLSKLLAKDHQLFVVFYGAQWCPICKEHLSTLKAHYAFIKELNAQVLAISQKRPKCQRETKNKTTAEFLIDIDEEHKVAGQFDGLYQPDGAKRSMYNIALGAKLKKAHSDKSKPIPVPATFITNAHKEIIWRHFDRNYKNRPSVKAILKAIKNA